MKAVAIAVSAGLALLTVAVAGIARQTTGNSVDGSQSTGVVRGHGSAILPAETATDWVTYADHVLIVQVESDAELPAPVDVERGEGYIGRTATLRVEQRLWSRLGGPLAPDILRISVAGWALLEGKRHDFAVMESPRIEVGHRYIAPFARLAGGDWVPLSPAAVLPYDGVVGWAAAHFPDS